MYNSPQASIKLSAQWQLQQSDQHRRSSSYLTAMLPVLLKILDFSSHSVFEALNNFSVVFHSRTNVAFHLVLQLNLLLSVSK